MDRLAPWLTRLFRLWTASMRYKENGPGWPHLQEDHREGKPLILSLWHNELFSLAGWGSRRGRFVVLVSQSKDGEFIARIIEGMGQATARGSSTRGGLKALLTAKRLMETEGRIACFTVDGPKGPRHEVKDGVLFLAHLTGAAIYPLRALPRRRKVFAKSWDRFELPMPFTRCVIRTGAPLFVQAEELTPDNLVRERARLKAAMDALDGPLPE